jgi:hypothetical protein
MKDMCHIGLEVTCTIWGKGDEIVFKLVSHLSPRGVCSGITLNPYLLPKVIVLLPYMYAAKGNPQ